MDNRRENMIEFDNEKLSKRIDEVLYYVWDPIGVSDEPYARREYVGYIKGIRDLLDQGDDIASISSHLASIVSSSMCLSPDKKKCDYTAELLLRHKRAIIEGCA